MYEDTYVGTCDGAVRFLEEVGHDACGLNPDIGNFIRLHRPIEPVQEMLDKVLPYANYWHVKNYLRDEDPATGQVMTFPVPMDFGLINYRAAIAQALDLGFRGAFLCEHYGSDAITVIGRNRAYIRDILSTPHRLRRSTHERLAQRTVPPSSPGPVDPAGIGRVTARVLAENGWHVALVDINADGLAAVEAELRDAGHDGVISVAADIASQASVAEAFARIDAELPPVVGLVNLAGIACHDPAGSSARSGGVQPGDGGERHRLVPDAAGRRRADDPAGRRPDRQHLLDHRVRRRRHLLQGRLRHREGRRDRDVPRAAPGSSARTASRST